MDDLVDRVRHGAELLDREKPSWYREIATDHLAMWNCSDCIVGQLFGFYATGYPWLRRSFYERSPSSKFIPADFGFDLPHRVPRRGNDSPDWVDLADAWRAEIRARLEREAP
jgi:hypothetical protein